jgi:hypothetical protein
VAAAVVGACVAGAVVGTGAEVGVAALPHADKTIATTTIANKKNFVGFIFSPHFKYEVG